MAYKKIIVVLMVLCLLFALPLSVSAVTISKTVTIDDASYATESTDGNIKSFRLTYSTEHTVWNLQTPYALEGTQSTTLGMGPLDFNFVYTGKYMPLGVYYLDVSGLDGCTNLKIQMPFTGQFTVDQQVQIVVTVNCYDVDGNSLGALTLYNATTGPYPAGDAYYALQPIAFDLNLPSGTRYIQPFVSFRVSLPAMQSVQFKAGTLWITGDVNMLESTDNGVQDILKELQREEQEANKTGNEGIDQITGAIPDESAGFMDALSGFVSSMSYSGTDAVLTIPAVSFPSVAGVAAFTMLEGQELDFGQYIGMMPDNLLLLVQSLFTIALIVYCFKELYDTIQYVLTLRGGGN